MSVVSAMSDHHEFSDIWILCWSSVSYMNNGHDNNATMASVHHTSHVADIFFLSCHSKYRLPTRVRVPAPSIHSKTPGSLESVGFECWNCFPFMPNTIQDLLLSTLYTPTSKCHIKYLVLKFICENQRKKRATGEIRLKRLKPKKERLQISKWRMIAKTETNPRRIDYGECE